MSYARYMDSPACTNIVYARTEADIDREFAGCAWHAARPAADHEVEAALAKGMPTWELREGRSDMAIVDGNEKTEFIGQVIDIFEDYLSERAPDLGKSMSNDDKTQAIADGSLSADEADAVVFYGGDYDAVADQLADVLAKWGVLEQ